MILPAVGLLAQLQLYYEFQHLYFAIILKIVTNDNIIAVPSAITGLFVEATTNPTFTFTMVAGSPAERMTVAIVTLAVTTISLILLAIRKCIVRKDGDERAGPTDVFESVKVHPSPQKIDAAFLGNLPNLEQNDMSFSDALVTTPEGFIQNGLDEMFDGMNLDKSRTDYVDESMFLREASDQES
eukprot:Em0007g1438a